MQNTKFRNFLLSFLDLFTPIIYSSWSKRSVSLLSLLLGFYISNSLLSYLLDKSFDQQLNIDEKNFLSNFRNIDHFIIYFGISVISYL